MGYSKPASNKHAGATPCHETNQPQASEHHGVGFGFGNGQSDVAVCGEQKIARSLGVTVNRAHAAKQGGTRRAHSVTGFPPRHAARPGPMLFCAPFLGAWLD